MISPAHSVALGNDASLVLFLSSRTSITGPKSTFQIKDHCNGRVSSNLIPTLCAMHVWIARAQTNHFVTRNVWREVIFTSKTRDFSAIVVLFRSVLTENKSRNV